LRWNGKEEKEEKEDEEKEEGAYGSASVDRIDLMVKVLGRSVTVTMLMTCRDKETTILHAIVDES